MRWVVVEFAAVVNATVPLPFPFAPLVIEIQATGDDADHVQPEGAATAKVPEPPVDPNERLVGVTLYVQDTPACVTLTDCPAMVSEPVRCDVLEFDPTEKVTVPFPSPLEPFVIEIHVADDAAVHGQPTGAVTENVPEALDDPSERLVGDTA